MSAELMKSKFICRPSVCGIDYLWCYCMDFFQILVFASPGPYMANFFFNFENTNKQTKKTTTTHFWIFFYLLRIFFVFVNMGSHGSENFKTLLLQSHSKTIWKLSWIFPPMVLTKLRFGFLKFWVTDFNDFFFRKTEKYTIVACAVKQNSIIWKTSDSRATVTEWNLGLVGSDSTYIGYFCHFSVQSHVGVIRCT